MQRSLGLALATGVLGRAGSASAAEAGVVAWLRGTATATTSGGGTRILHVGAVVHEGDELRTLTSARISLQLAGGATLAIGEESRLVVTSQTATPAGGGSVILDLLDGIVRAVLGPARPDIFEVRGRAAVAAARATDFIVASTPATTAVFTAAGTVAVSAVEAPGEALLGPGQGMDATRGEPLGPVKEWGAGRIAEFEARTAVGR
ncbi:MAG: FecR domain-containing protein [Geminicoccaceae bacterium]